MSFINIYRQRVSSLRTEIARLMSNKARESTKLARENQRSISAQQSLSRISSRASVKSKLSIIERANKEISNIQSRIAKIEIDIANKEKLLVAAEANVAREELRISQKQIDDARKQSKKHEKMMKELYEKPNNQYINNGGQMNIATDNAIIYATYNANEEKSELFKLIYSIVESDLSQLSDAEQEILRDNLEVIRDEISCDKPRVGFLKTALAGLTNLLSSAASLAEPLQKIITFTQTIIK